MSHKKKALEQDLWVKLVHEGSCCSFEDPQKEEKELFIKESQTAKKPYKK